MEADASHSGTLNKNLHTLAERAPELARRLAAWAADAPAGWQRGVAAGTRPPDAPHVYPFMVLFAGLSDPAFVRRWYVACPDSVATIALCEASLEQCARFLACDDWTELCADPRVVWYVGEAQTGLREWWREYLSRENRMELIGRIDGFHAQTSGAESPAYYAQFFAGLQEAIQLYDPLRHGNVDDDYAGVCSVIANLEHFLACPLVDSLRDAGRGLPGMVVATGPSLRPTLAQLDRPDTHAMICCCDSAVPIVTGQSVTPHAVTCLERVPATFRLVQQFPALPETLLVATPVVNALTLHAFSGPKAFMNTAATPMGWVRDAVQYDCGNTTATMALMWLHYLGCSPIYLVGQDLAFDRETAHSHAEGAHAYLQAVGAQDRERAARAAENWVPGNNGAPILTSPVYRSMALNLSTLIRNYRMTCYNVIPPAYGMAIADAIWMAPADAAVRLARSTATPDVRRELQQRLRADRPPTREHLAARLRTLATELQHIVEMARQQRLIVRELSAVVGGVRAEEATIQAGMIRLQAAMTACLQLPVVREMVSQVVLKLHVPIMRAVRETVWNGLPAWRNYGALLTLMDRWFEAMGMWCQRIRCVVVQSPLWSAETDSPS